MQPSPTYCPDLETLCLSKRRQTPTDLPGGDHGEAKTLAEIEVLDVEELAPGLVAIALELARQLDECEATTSADVVARELRATMLELWKVAPVRAAAADSVNELTARRKKRRGA
ncbi:hypothetical protein ACIRLA_33740 [Streptomyces sp. NPDC102364]|uniref:hypothetical protein n=1 Tax=Streptomyces sp. NPDC102364 TaxID=3366161 RepID=UPI00380E362A